LTPRSLSPVAKEHGVFDNIGIFGIILLALDIWALINVLQSSADVPKKVGWVLLIVVLPLLGFIIWAFAGPRTRKKA
jgi:hypothetical protein